MWSSTALTGRKLTEEGRGRDGSVTTGDHDADARLHEGHGEVHHLRPLLVDGERADCHVRPLVHNLENRTKALTEILQRWRWNRKWSRSAHENQSSAARPRLQQKYVSV